MSSFSVFLFLFFLFMGCHVMSACKGEGEGGPRPQTPPPPPHTHSGTGRQTGTHTHTHQQQQQQRPPGGGSGSCLHLLRGRRPSVRPVEQPRTGGGGWGFEDAGERPEGVQGGSAGEAQRRAAAALEEEAVRPDGGRRPAAAAEAARPAASPPAAARRRRRRGRRGLFHLRGQSQGAALRQHEDGGLRGAQGQVRLLHGGHDRGQGDRLPVPAGRGLERGDHAADGAVQEPPGDPGRQVHPAEAAAARCADARPEDPPQRAQRGVTRGETRGQRRAVSG